MIGARARAGIEIGLVLAVLGGAAWPLPEVAIGFSRLYCSVANVVLTRNTFGLRGHARVDAVGRIERREGDNVTADTVLALTVDGFEGAVPLGISLRRDVYLPALMTLAIVLCSRLSVRRRLACVAIALPVLFAAGVAANAVVAAWTFAVQMHGVYPPAPTSKRLIEFAYSALLSPPGNRFIAPILLGICLVLWQRTRAARPRHGATQPRPDPGPAGAAA